MRYRKGDNLNANIHNSDGIIPQQVVFHVL